MSNKLENQLRLQMARIAELEAEVALLRDLLKKTDNRRETNRPQFNANQTLKSAIETAQSGKWWHASMIVADHYGIDFMLKGSPNFEILKKSMYEYFQMPSAPARSDKSSAANHARERRREIRAMVYTYIDRMGDYFLRRSGL